jgi:GMP synthase-like glutamine amidotransferase
MQAGTQDRNGGDSGPLILILNDEYRLDGPEKTGFVADGIRERGRIDWIDLSRGAALPEALDRYDGLVLTGGEMSVFEAGNKDRVARLADTYLSFNGARKPVLGLCLGAQIIAQAHGASVERMHRMQFGFDLLRPTDHARDDPVLSWLQGGVRVFEAHRDRFSLPAGSVQLMVGADEPNQVFRMGTTSYAFQCHFEATRDLIVEWADFIARDLAPWLGDDAEDRLGAVFGEMDDAMPEAEQFARRVMNGWMGLFD